MVNDKQEWVSVTIRHGSHLLTVNCQVGVALEVTQNTQGQFHTYKGVTNSQNGCTLVTV